MLLLLAVGACVGQRRGTADTVATGTGSSSAFARLAPLFILLIVYGGFALRSSLNIGHRHVLPMYPPLFILAGAAGLLFRRTPPAITTSTKCFLIRSFVLASLLANAAEALWIWPDYLAYFNVVAGGPRHGYRWLVDSSLVLARSSSGIVGADFVRDFRYGLLFLASSRRG